jgi:hypothetical protein
MFAAVAAVFAATVGTRAPQRARVEPVVAPVSIHVPFVATAIHVGAEMADKRVWDSEAGSTQNFKDANGNGMVPYSEMRARWGNGMLYLWLYAGDLDLEGRVREADGDLTGDDAFHIELGAGERVHAIDVSVLGTVSDAVCTRPASAPGPRPVGECDRRWQSHATVAVDVDGSLNRIHDNDEEWLVEMAIPLVEVGVPASAARGARIPFSVSRCEVGYDGRHACGGWGVGQRRELVLDPVVAQLP